YDEGESTPSGWGKIAVAQHNLKVVAEVHNNENEAHCVILQDLRRNRLVVSFRGTSSSAHWNTNLKFNMAKYDLERGDLPREVQQLLLAENSSSFASFDAAGEDGGENVFRSNVDTETDLGADDLASNLLRSRRVFSGDVEAPADRPKEVLEFLRDGMINVESAVLSKFASGVHSGFLESYLSVRSEVAYEIAKHVLKNPCDVFFTGHSMGGAIAAIA
ncbi:hypothetical protein TeGR_g909, partial [Tetraparma gracilis]